MSIKYARGFSQANRAAYFWLMLNIMPSRFRDVFLALCANVICKRVSQRQSLFGLVVPYKKIASQT